MAEITAGMVKALRDKTGGRGPDAVIDAVGMEAHGSSVKAVHKLVGMLPDVIAEPLLKTAGMDRLTALHSAFDAVRRGGTVSIVGVYGGAADPTGCEVREGFVGAGERVRLGRHLDRDRRGDGEELPPVVSGVGRDAAHLAFFEQMTFVVQRRHVGEVDACDGDHAASVEGFECDRYEVADRCEHDCAVERFGWRVVRAGRRRGAERERESLGLGAARHHVHVQRRAGVGERRLEHHRQLLPEVVIDGERHLDVGCRGRAAAMQSAGPQLGRDLISR